MMRIGLFYDGSYFARVSNFYRYHHQRRARISIAGFHDFLRHEVSRQTGVATRFCQIVEAHYYRGRFSAEEVEKRGKLLGERKFEDALVKARVMTHFIPVSTFEDGRTRARGADILLALDAYGAAVAGKINFIVLITGDGDFVHLVERLNALDCQVMVTAWDMQSPDGMLTLRTSHALLDAVPYPIMMQSLIDDETRTDDALINQMFMDEQPRVGLEGAQVVSDGHVRPESLALNDEDGEDAEAEWATGVVVNLPSGRDFGFIKPDYGSENLFFHATWMDFDGVVEAREKFNDLRVGDRVEFDIGRNPKTGQPTATNVTVVN